MERKTLEVNLCVTFANNGTPDTIEAFACHPFPNGKKFSGVRITDAGRNPYVQEYFLNGKKLVDEDEDSSYLEDEIEAEYPGLITSIFSHLRKYAEFDSNECRFVSLMKGTEEIVESWTLFEDDEGHY